MSADEHDDEPGVTDEEALDVTTDQANIYVVRDDHDDAMGGESVDGDGGDTAGDDEAALVLA